MRLSDIAAIGLVLGIALAVAFGLYFAGGCAKAQRYRPPLALQAGPIWSSPTKPNDDVQMFGRINLITRPVGGWVDMRYSVERGEVGAVSAGVTIVFPGGEYWTPKEEEDEEILMPPESTR